MEIPENKTKEQLQQDLEELRSKLSELEKIADERPHMDEALKESEEKYKLLYENAPLSYQSLNEDGSFRDVNPAWLQTLGYQREEVIGKFYANFLHPDWKAHFETNFPAFKKRGYVHDVQFKIRHKDGHYLDISFEGCIGYLPDGSFKQTYCVFQDITERRKAEEKLHESEEKFRRIFELSPIGKSMTGIDGSLHVNKAFCEIVGYSEEELNKKHWKEITHPDDIQRSAEAVQALIDGKIDRANYQKRYIQKNGNVVWTDVITALYKDNDGNINSFITTIIDITDRKKTEETLNRQTKRLSDILEGTNAGTWDWNIQTGAVVLNERWAEIMGRTLNELEPIDINTWINSVHPDDLPMANAALEKHFKGELNYFDVEFRQPHKNGSWMWVNARGKVIEWNKDGKPMQMSGTHLDITERKLSEIMYRDEKERISTILDMVGDPIFVKDNDHRITLANRAFYDIFGMDEKSVIGYTLVEAVPESERHHFLKVDRSVLDTGIPDLREEELTVGDHTRTIITRKIRFIDQSGKIFMVGSIHDITERKQAEKALIENEEKFRMLLNKSPFPMVIADLHSNVELTNESFKTLIGYSEQDISNVNDWRNLAYPDEKYRNEMKNCWQEETENALRENRLVEPYEAKIRCKDGSDRIFSIIDTQIGDKYLIVYSDLTQRIKAEEERDRFFNVSLDLLCVAGTDGYFKQMNPAWEEVLGWTITELKAKPFFDFIHPDDINLTLKEVEKLATGVPAIRFTNRYQCKDGTYKWLTWNTAPFGEVLYAVATDVTDLKNAQDKVTELLGRLNLALEGGNVGIWEWDLATDETIWDNRMEAMFGLAPGTFDGTYDAFKKRLVPDDVEITVEAIEKALSGEKSYDIVHRSKWDSGEIRFINAKAIVAKNSKGYNERMIGVCYDVTELKVAEQNLQMIADELKRSNHELEQFAYVASHDLQQPLRMVTSYTQLLEKKYKDQIDEKANLYIHYAVDGAKRMQVLINDLLAYSRVASKGEAFSLIDTNEVVKNSLSNLEMMIREKDAKISFENLPEIFGDSTQIQSLFQNLIENAIKYSGDRRPEIHISAKSKGNKQIFSVKDNGIGIDAKFQEKVFVIFQRLHTRDEYSGTGIGLAICKRIVNRHGGEIWFESEKDKGTTFYFSMQNKTQTN